MPRWGWVARSKWPVLPSACPLEKSTSDFDNASIYRLCAVRCGCGGGVAYVNGTLVCSQFIVDTTHSGNAHHAAQLYRCWIASSLASSSVRLNLCCSTTSSRWCKTRCQCSRSARLFGSSSHLSISNTVPSRLFSLTSNLSRLAWGTHSRLPSNWTSPVLSHSPSEKRVLPNSQRGHGSAVWRLASSVGTGARSF